MAKEQETTNNIKIFIKSIRSDLAEDSKDNQKLANDIETVLNMLKEKDKEMEKKDKIIDLMTTFIDAQNIRMLEDEYTAIKNIYTIIGFDKDKEGIKQYFERKVKE